MKRFATAAAVLLAALALGGCAQGVERESSGANADTETERVLDAHRSGWAEYFNLSSPPDVEVTRWLYPEEVDTIFTECLEIAGYEVLPGGSIRYREGQEEAFAVDQFRCRAAYPVYPRYTGAWGEAQYQAQYAWVRDGLIPCLADRGHVITGLPSESTFIDNWDTAPFSAYEQVIVDIQDPTEYNVAMHEMNQECPQQAPSVVLWDGKSIAEYVQSPTLPAAK